MRKLEKVAQGCGRYPNPGNSQGQVGWGFVIWWKMSTLIVD